MVGRDCMDIEGTLRHRGVGGCNGGTCPSLIKNLKKLAWDGRWLCC